MILDKDKYTLESPARDNKSPKVSIGMPVYNGEKYIRQALESLLSQTFTSFELIISDNASTDQTRQICLEYAARDQRIHYYRNKVTVGGVTNFNHVLDLATGQYFMWAAYDDIWDAVFIERLTQALDINPRAGLAFCHFVLIDAEGRLERTFKIDWSGIFARSKTWQFGFMSLLDELKSRKANFIYGLMRRNALLECGGMTILPGVSYAGEDVLTLLRLLAKWDFTIVNQVLFHYRIRPQPVRNKEPLAGYIWERITRQKLGHQGSLILFFIRNHALHSNMRKLIATESPLPLFKKLLLQFAILLKEIWFPISFLPIGVLRELRIHK